MKGYSFSELVKLAEAAMPRAGGTFDGAITAPQVNIGNSQSSDPKAATRFDWVNARLQEKLSLSGGSMSGQLIGKTTGVPNRLEQLNGQYSAFNVANIEVDPASQGGVSYAEALHSSSQVKGVGFVQHMSLGQKRQSGASYHDVYLATGGSDTGATVEWLFGSTGVLACPGAVLLGGSTQATQTNAAVRRDYLLSQLGNYLPLSGGTVQGQVVIAHDANTLNLRPKTAAAPSYLLGQDYAGNNQWYVGKGGTSADIYLHNYVGGSNLQLEDGGTIALNPGNRQVWLNGYSLSMCTAGNKEFRMCGANGEDHFALWHEPASGEAHLRVNGGGACTLQADGSFVSPARIWANDVTLNSGKASLRTATPGGHADWWTRIPALQVYADAPSTAATSVWMAGELGVSQIAAMDVNRPEAGAIVSLHLDGGYAQHQWTHRDYTASGAVRGLGGVFDAGSRVYSPVNVPILSATHGYNDVINGGTFNVGAYAFHQNHPDLKVGTIAPGETCDGSRLFPTSVDSDWDDMYGAPVPGVWRCQGYSNLGGPVPGGLETDWTAG
ncbi:hypothetical protein ACR2VD_27505, partial [Klebsiella pneumoniae]